LPGYPVNKIELLIVTPLIRWFLLKNKGNSILRKTLYYLVNLSSRAKFPLDLNLINLFIEGANKISLNFVIFAFEHYQEKIILKFYISILVF